MRTKSAFTVIAIVITAIMFMGCEGKKGPQGPEGPSGNSPIYIIGQIKGPGWFNTTDSSGRVDIWVSGLNEVAVVEVNGIPIPFYPGNVPLRYENLDFPIFAGDQAQLVMTYGSSNVATATIIMPDSFELVSPPIGTSLIIGDTLSFQWTISNGADAYHVIINTYLWYHDTLGVGQTFIFHIDTLITQTEISFPPNRIFPETIQIDTVFEGSGSIELSAISGPVFNGDPGNIQGDGTGVLNGWTFGAGNSYSVQLNQPMVMPPQRMEGVLSSFFNKE
jgi:hypothetical protein